MGRAPCCSKVGLHRGPWTAREDKLLINYIRANGEGHWRSLPKKAGLLRCGKSCRLRWMNYLRPDIKRGNITPDEEDLIIRLHSLLGNRWSLIAGRLPGRTDNEIKNYWNSHLSKRFKNKEKCSTSTTDHHQPIRKSSEKKMKGNQENGNGDTTKTAKIHLPKAVRVSSVSVASIGARIGDDDLLRSSIWSGFDKAAGNEDGGDLACGYLSSCLDCMPANDHNMLNEMFDEYDQLLNTDNYGRLDSFIDSLLA